MKPLALFNNAAFACGAVHPALRHGHVREFAGVPADFRSPTSGACQWLFSHRACLTRSICSGAIDDLCRH
jgi:hypothetical protein